MVGAPTTVGAANIEVPKLVGAAKVVGAAYVGAMVSTTGAACWCNLLDDWCCLHSGDWRCLHSGDWCWELLHNFLNLNPWHLPHNLLNHDPGHLPYNLLNDNLWHRHNFLNCLHLRNFNELSTICTCGTSTTFSTV